MSTLSERLSLLRKEKDISMAKLAADIGVSRSLISKYEKSIREPGREMLILLADYFNVSVDYLLGKTENADNKEKPTVELDDERAKKIESILSEVENMDDGEFDRFYRAFQVLFGESEK